MSKNNRLLLQKRINSQELNELLVDRSDGEIEMLLIDVREQYEYEEGHIVGVDLLLPTTKFQEWAPMLAASYSDIPIILTCRTSNRTSQAQNILMQMGMDNVVDHIGGIVAYEGDVEQGVADPQIMALDDRLQNG